MITFARRRARVQLGRHPAALAALILVCGSLASLAAQRAGDARPQPFAGGAYEASGVAAVPGTTGVLFVDDGRPRHVFWMPLLPTGAQAGDVVPIPLPADVPDMEDLAFDGTYFYAVGSQSQGGGRQTDGLVRFRFDAARRVVTNLERVTGLRQWLTEAAPDVRGRGRAAGGGVNIEGLVWDPNAQRLLLGLRSPLANGRALVVPIRLRDRDRPLENGNLMVDGPLLELDLGGDAIRGLGYDAEAQRFLVLSGASTYGPSADFRLLDWDGRTSTGLRPRGVYPAAWKPEGVTRLRLGGRMRTLLVFDAGGFLIAD